jgi:hypothetical protein
MTDGLRRDFGVFIIGEHTQLETENLNKGIKFMLNKYVHLKKSYKLLQWKCKIYYEKAVKYDNIQDKITKGYSLISYQKLEYYKNIEALMFRKERGLTTLQ